MGEGSIYVSPLADDSLQAKNESGTVVDLEPSNLTFVFSSVDERRRLTGDKDHSAATAKCEQGER
ncbi:hypothetical protein Dimus_022595, partial [Dionaea muscipula]